ncbi:Hypothetical protein A7982_11696 [Minicystis rosea]|nr:Hypothetical protein A7982_11696 [Minicystis rosea]
MSATRRFQADPTDGGKRPARPSQPAPETPSAAPLRAAFGPRQVNALQRSIGNRAVRALLSQGASEPAQALPHDVRSKMEESFGADFGDVKIHEGRRAEEIGAEAFTRGDDIHFAPGRYHPHDEAGQRLLGHELTHVMQQRAGGGCVSQAKGGPLVADRGLESEADVLGERAARGEPVRVRGTAAPRGIQRMIARGKQPGFKVKGVYDDTPFTGVVASEKEEGGRPSYRIELDPESAKVLGKEHVDVEHLYLDANQEDEAAKVPAQDPVSDKALAAFKAIAGKDGANLSENQVKGFETKMLSWISGPAVANAEDLLLAVVSKRPANALTFVKPLTNLLLREPAFIVKLAPRIHEPLIEAVRSKQMSTPAEAYLLEGIIQACILTGDLARAQEILLTCLTQPISMDMECGRLLLNLVDADMNVGLAATEQCIRESPERMSPGVLLRVAERCVSSAPDAIGTCIQLYARAAPKEMMHLASLFYALPLPKAALRDVLSKALSPVNEPVPMRLLTHALLDKVETTSLPKKDADTIHGAEGLHQRTALFEFGKALIGVLDRLDQDSRLSASQEPLRRLHAALAECREYVILVQVLLEGQLDDNDNANVEGIRMLVESISESIKKLGTPPEGREIFVYPTGFTVHATLLAVIRQLDDLYQIVQLNTGDGVDAHGARRTIGGKAKQRTYLRIRDVKAEDATSPELWGSLVRNDAAKDMTGVYSTLAKVPGARENENDVPDVYFEMVQRIGTCTWQSIMALLRFYLLEAYRTNPKEGLLQYKILKSKMSDAVFDEVMAVRPPELSSAIVEAASMKRIKRARYRPLERQGAEIDFEGVKKELVARLERLAPEGKSERVARAIGMVASLKKPAALADIDVVDLLYETFVAALRETGIDPVGIDVDGASPILAAAFARYREP